MAAPEAETRVFGEKIETVMSRPNEEHIPSVLRQMFASLVKSAAMETVGIFRVSAGVKDLQSLKNSFDAGEKVTLKKHDPHLVAGLLKAYFIELPEPLFTFILYENFIAASDAPDVKAKLRDIVKKLPLHNRMIANCLFLYLSRVVTKSEVNKMTSTNLAIVFGQILLRPKVETLELLRHAPKITNVLKIMIDNVNDIFPRSAEDESLAAKGHLTSVDHLIGLKPKKKSKKDEIEKLTPEQQKLKNIKVTVEDAINILLERLDNMSTELNGSVSLGETIEIAKRVRTAKRILFTTGNSDTSGGESSTAEN